MKLIVSEIQSTIARVIGTCANDTRVYDYINQACRRLLNKGLWSGTYGRFTIYPSSCCITWPRQIETIEAIADCCTVGTVRNQWFEFQDSGFGLLTDSNCCVGNQLVDRGTVVSYRDLSGGTNSYIRVYPGDASDAGKTITLQGYDQNGQWIRTQSGGAWIDGEKLTLALPYVQSTKKFTSLTGVIRQATNTVSRLYEYNATAATETDIAVYDPDETVPQYRRSFLTSRCKSDDEDKPVTVMAKMRHINATGPNDYIIPPCADAIKLMVQSIRKEENDLIQEAMAYEAKAVQTVQEQTMHHLGDAVSTIKMVGGAQYGGQMYTFF